MKRSARHLIHDLLNVFSSKAKNKLNKQDYDTDDFTVSGFFDFIDEPNNERVVTSAINNSDLDMCVSLVDTLEKSINKEATHALRYAYHNLVKSYPGVNSESPLLLEDLNLNVPDLNPVAHRLESLKGMEKYAELSPDQRSFSEDIQNLITSGSEDSMRNAAGLIKAVFASGVPAKNIKVAYTTLNTQMNEPYQMCPKAQKQIGWAVPMELSKCRDYCIDSRKTRTGDITCAYQDWLRVVADNQESVMARLENSKISDENLFRLNDIERPGPSDKEDSRESMLEKDDILKEHDKYYKRKDILENSIEENLEIRKLNNKQAGDKSRILTASKENKANMNKFNLTDHIKSVSINEKLDEYRKFFKDSFRSESPSELTNKDYDNSKYENATSLDSLVNERRTGTTDDIVINDSLEAKRSATEKSITSTQEEALEQKRKNDNQSFMKTLEDHLASKRTEK